MRDTAFRAALAVLSVGVGWGVASAQTDIEANSGTQFNYSRPGTRALALGGAFVALADDGSAALTNPAGLPSLKKPEVMVEGRRFNLTSVFTDKGRLIGTPSGIGIDTVNGLVDGKAKSNLSRPSYASVVLPKGPFAIAAYYWDTAAFDTSFRTSGAFTGIYRLFPTANDLSYNIKGIGGSAAFHLKSGIAVGIGATHYDFSISSLTRRYEFTSNGCSPCDQAGQAFGPPDFSPANVNNQQTQSGTDKKWGFHFGVLAQMSTKLQIGYGIRIAPRFDFQALSRGGAEFSNENVVSSSAPGTFHLPDELAFGVVYRPSEALTVTTEFRRMRYSTLADRFVLLLSYPQPGPSGANFKADDGNEYHAGAEYTIKRANTRILLRGGAWYDPQHTVYFSGSTDIGAGFGNVRLPKRKGTIHGAGGVGLDVGGHLLIDAGVDVASRVTTASAAATLRP
jgi:long-chain fatty acid transport protein